MMEGTTSGIGCINQCISPILAMPPAALAILTGTMRKHGLCVARSTSLFDTGSRPCLQEEWQGRDQLVLGAAVGVIP